MQHGDHKQTPSCWTTGWIERLPVGLSLLDVASGYGRHSLLADKLGFKVTAVDQDPKAIDFLNNCRINAVCADLEKSDIDLGKQSQLSGQFDCVVVTNYLWRPRWFQLMRWLKPDGVLIYETFADGHASYGRPARPDFLLRDGELLTRCRQFGLQIIAFEDGVELHPNPVRVQRVCAIGPTRKRDSLILKYQD